MSRNLELIHSFIQKHHVMSLATKSESMLSVCSLFYFFDVLSNSFIVASSDTTNHIKHIQKNAEVAGNILLETKTIGDIVGVQFQALFEVLQSEALSEKYFTEYPYAKELNPQLWQIKVTSYKMTDNKLGFSKKITWPESF